MKNLFRLDKMAYFSCLEEHKGRFGKLNVPIIDLKSCCHEHNIKIPIKKIKSIYIDILKPLYFAFIMN